MLAPSEPRVSTFYTFPTSELERTGSAEIVMSAFVAPMAFMFRKWKRVLLKKPRPGWLRWESTEVKGPLSKEDMAAV